MQNLESNKDIAALQRPDPVTPIDSQRSREQDATAPHPANRVYLFIEELRRRKVCRALTMYAVALWLISQIVDLAYEQLGLPDWTLRFVLIIGLAGLPIALLLSWLLELQPNGVVLDGGGAGRGPQAKKPRSRGAIDGVLLFAAIAIAAQLAWTSLNETAAGSLPSYERITVAPFRVGLGEDAVAFSQNLTTELQYELTSNARFRVIAAPELFAVQNCFTLTGGVSTDNDQLRITATLIDNESKEIIWTEVIRKEREASSTLTADIAQELVSLLKNELSRLGA